MNHFNYIIFFVAKSNNKLTAHNKKIWGKCTLFLFSFIPSCFDATQYWITVNWGFSKCELCLCVQCISVMNMFLF